MLHHIIRVVAFMRRLPARQSLVINTIIILRITFKRKALYLPTNPPSPSIHHTTHAHTRTSAAGQQHSEAAAPAAAAATKSPMMKQQRNRLRAYGRPSVTAAGTATYPAHQGQHRDTHTQAHTHATVSVGRGTSVRRRQNEMGVRTPRDC